MPSATESVNSVKTGLQFASEVVVPGGSNLINGDLKQGGLHVVLGLVAGTLFGVPGLIVVAANSLTKATTGRHLHESLITRDTTKK